MRIAFDAKRAFNNSTGLGNYSRILLNNLMRYFPDNDYLLCAPKLKEEFFHQLNGNFKIVLPQTKFQKSFHPFWRSYGLSRQLQREDVNIYHGLSNELPFNIHPSGIRSVVTIHDLIFLKHRAQYPFIDRQFYQLKTKYAAKHADKIITVSQQTKNDLVEFYKVAEEKIEVIYPPVEEGFIKPANRDSLFAVRNKYRLPVNYILHVGSFFPRKNHRTLIAAFDSIKNKVQQSLVLIGSQGTMKKEIEAMISGKNLQDRVKILSRVSNEDLPLIYQSANLLVFPSLYEGFGSPVLEALYSKVPVITTKGGSMEEAGGKDSLFVDPMSKEELADALLKVLNNESLRNQMIERGFVHAQTISGKSSAEKMMQVYKRLA